MIAFGQLAPLLVRSRELLDEIYLKLVAAAATRDGVPCAVAATYREVSARQIAIESQVVVELRKKNIKPPDAIPVALGLVNGCNSQQDDLKLGGDQVDFAKHRAQTLLQGYQKFLSLLVQAYRVKSAKEIFEKRLSELRQFARRGTDEELPPPNNLSLLRCIYYFGGTHWPVPEAERAFALQLKLEPQEVQEHLQALLLLRTSVDDFFVLRGAPQLFAKRSPLWGVLGAAASAAVAAAALYLTQEDPREFVAVGRRRPRARPRRQPEEEPIDTVAYETPPGYDGTEPPKVGRKLLTSRSETNGTVDR